MIMLNEDGDSSLVPNMSPKFERGQLVRHRRYKYRGVIVDFDLNCQADDSWYYSNQTQPDKNQTWYHVLVHDTDMTTYAAEENLTEDTIMAPINHPLIEYFFEAFNGDSYTRNEKPWPM